jgi:hypothetical protein
LQPQSAEIDNFREATRYFAGGGYGGGISA